MLTFDLMVRIKANCVVKNKYRERLLMEHENLIKRHGPKMIQNRLPNVVTMEKARKLSNQKDKEDEEFPSLLGQKQIVEVLAAPSMDEAYSQSRVLMNTALNYREMLNVDMEALLLDLDSKKSWGEEEMTPYVQEAIETVDSQLYNLNLFEKAGDKLSE